MLHSYVLRHTFENGVGYKNHMTQDGVMLPQVSTMDNSACVELLRGSQLSEPAHKKPVVGDYEQVMLVFQVRQGRR